MTLKKDKEKVIDEVWTEARIREFLDTRAYDEVDVDFHTLLKAYQQMKAEDFGQFVQFFKEAGRNLDACNPQGQTLADLLATQPKAAPYLQALNSAR